MVRELTAAVNYKPHKLYYIAITPETFIKDSSPHLYMFIEVYIGYWTRVDRKLTKFASSEFEVPMSDTDAMSGNWCTQVWCYCSAILRPYHDPILFVSILVTLSEFVLLDLPATYSQYTLSHGSYLHMDDETIIVHNTYGYNLIHAGGKRMGHDCTLHHVIHWPRTLIRHIHSWQAIMHCEETSGSAAHLTERHIK